MNEARLGECVEIINGFAFKSELFSTERSGLPVARIRDVVRGYSETFYSGEFPDNVVLRNGDLLVGMDGEFNVGRWAGGRALLNQRVCKVNAKETLLDRNYLKHLLPRILQRIEDATPFVTVKHLSSEDLKEQAIRLPSLDEQKRIAAILERADRLRRLRRFGLETGETVLDAAFRERFAPRFKSASCVSLGELVRITGGGTPSRDCPEYFQGRIPWLTSKDMRGEYITDTEEHITERAIEDSCTNLVPAGSILVVVKSKVLMHRLPLAISKVALCHGQDIKSIQCSPELEPEFARFVLKHHEPRLLQIARGANTEGLTLPMLRELLVPKVSMKEQQAFAHLAQRVERLRSFHRESLRQAEHLFQALLQRAFAAE
ncbi:MAG: restriction endonuclease subunit S [Gemmataceae bacterium]